MRVVRWLDSHNGAVTAVATIAIALLTWFLHADSRKQLGEMRAENASNDTTTGKQIALMDKQATAMQGQLDEMRDEKRAWVSLQIKFTEGPNSSHFHYVLKFKFILKNTGGSPAFNVVFKHFSEFSKPRDITAASRWLKTRNILCEAVRTHLSRQEGESIFPGDDPLTRPFKEMVDQSSADFSEIATMGSYQFAVFGCVIYRTADQETHQTPFFFTLRMPEPYNYDFEKPPLQDVLMNQFGANQADNYMLVPPSAGMPGPN